MDFDIYSLFMYFLYSILIFIILVVAAVRLMTSPHPKTFRTKKEETFYDPVTKIRHKFPSLQDPHSVHLSVVVPSYNEEERLPPMLDECINYLEERQGINRNFKYEVIIVNDGSKDKTTQVAQQYVSEYGCDKIRVLELEINRGKGGAVTMGVDSCRGAVVLFADADGATTFADLQKLESAMELLLKENYAQTPDKVATMSAIVCGSRAHLEQDAIAQRSVFRNFLMHGFHFLVWLLAVRSLKDTQCGFKLFTRQSCRQCFKSLHVQRWAFDVELLYIAERLCVPIVEVSVRWTEVGGSKLIPVWSWLQMGSDLFFIWFKYTIGAWKLVE